MARTVISCLDVRGHGCLPLLGILLVGFSELGNITEAALLFGGITLILLTLISLALPLSNTIFVIAIITIWLFTWIGPAMWLTSRSPTRRTQIIVCCVLSGISLGQAALGAVLIIGGNA